MITIALIHHLAQTMSLTLCQAFLLPAPHGLRLSIALPWTCKPGLFLLN